VPQELVWAQTKREEDAVTNTPSWECALMTTQHPSGAGWDATTTVWRAASRLLGQESLALGATLIGRVLNVGGCTFDLDVAGRPNPVGVEDLPPDVVVGNVESLVAHCEALGGDFDFVEKITLKKCRVYATEPGDPLAGGEVDSAFYRQTSDSVAVRVNG
jgi:hypothetical protein